MTLERIVWSLALLVVAVAAFFGGQQIGFARGQESRAAAAQEFFARRGAQNGAPPGDALIQPVGPGGLAGQNVAGVVARVDGNRIVVTTPDSATVTVELANDAIVRRQVETQISDIKPGERIVAFGTRNGEMFQARSVQLGGQRTGR
ncbi:MAG: hypothetical protein HXY39_01230 [Chloroflexi bacterium]|nr:hypothetical protein [Chloroflexota bacterium]